MCWKHSSKKTIEHRENQSGGAGGKETRGARPELEQRGISMKTHSHVQRDSVEANE